jgi:hypothetical protein
MKHTSTLGLLLTLSSVVACAPVDDLDGHSTASIVSGNSASQFQWQRAALVIGTSGQYCTATIIGSRHLLTASHCRFSGGNATAYFYTSAAQVDLSLARPVAGVLLDEGVRPSLSDFTASDGDFADFAVLALSSDIPSTSRVATMAWSYPGSDATGIRVGAGRHDDEVNPAFSLETNDDETHSSSDDGGSFHTKRNETNNGDSGGAFYLQGTSHLLGVLYGSEVVGLTRRNLYTSVPAHLVTVLRMMNYTGSYTITQGGGVPQSYLGRFSAESERACRYACDHANGCRAFSFAPNVASPGSDGQCYLRESSTDAVLPWPNTVTGVRQ